MNPRIIKRFVVLMAILLAVTVLGGDLLEGYLDRPPGDYYTEVGSNRLGEGAFPEALENFNKALEEAPMHRGALMGRALVFTRTGRAKDAEAEYGRLISHLEATLAPDDATGRGALYSAYANRGVLKDRQGRHEDALADYIEAIKVDQELAEKGPGWLNHLLYYNREPSTVLKRANYLFEQLQLPESERGPLLIPERDDAERMYKP